jgi:hypothetical protein
MIWRFELFYRLGRVFGVVVELVERLGRLPIVVAFVPLELALWGCGSSFALGCALQKCCELVDDFRRALLGCGLLLCFRVVCRFTRLFNLGSKYLSKQALKPKTSGVDGDEFGWFETPCGSR